MGLKAGQQKAINYSEVSTVSQSLDENPTTFSERLALESYERQVIMKDKFPTQSASDISRKLQKLIQEPRVSLNEMSAPANTVFHNGGRERQDGAQEKEQRNEVRHGTSH